MSRNTIELFKPTPLKIKKLRRLKFRYSDEYQRTEIKNRNMETKPETEFD